MTNWDANLSLVRFDQIDNLDEVEHDKDFQRLDSLMTLKRNHQIHPLSYIFHALQASLLSLPERSEDAFV